MFKFLKKPIPQRINSLKSEWGLTLRYLKTKMRHEDNPLAEFRFKGERLNKKNFTAVKDSLKLKDRGLAYKTNKEIAQAHNIALRLVYYIKRASNYESYIGSFKRKDK